VTLPSESDLRRLKIAYAMGRLDLPDFKRALDLYFRGAAIWAAYQPPGLPLGWEIPEHLRDMTA
jgi:hypothetical protein